MMKWWLSGCVLSCAIVVVMCVMALKLSCESVGGGTPIHLAAMFDAFRDRNGEGCRSRACANSGYSCVMKLDIGHGVNY